MAVERRFLAASLGRSARFDCPEYKDTGQLSPRRFSCEAFGALTPQPSLDSE